MVHSFNSLNPISLRKFFRNLNIRTFTFDYQSSDFHPNWARRFFENRVWDFGWQGNFRWRQRKVDENFGRNGKISSSELRKIAAFNTFRNFTKYYPKPNYLVHFIILNKIKILVSSFVERIFCKLLWLWKCIYDLSERNSWLRRK